MIENREQDENRNGWQPIETAPMDGTAIWLLVDGHPYIGYGEPAEWPYQTNRWSIKATFMRRDEMRKRNGLTDEVCAYHGVDVTATHWMPLPQPMENGHGKA